MDHRKPYLVNRALKNYLKGSVIIAISGQLVTTTDAIVVSHYIGPKGLTAVNIVIPILTLFSTLMILLGTGAAISIAKNMGLRNQEKINLSFTSTFITSIISGVLIGIITYYFTPIIVRYLVHGEQVVEVYARDYLQTFCYAAPFLVMAGVLERIVRTDGNTKLVRVAVWAGIILNVILDIIFVGYTKLGISGAAWATAINYFVTFVVCLFHFISRDNTIRWSSDIKDYYGQIKVNIGLGFSTSLNNLLMAVTLFVVNSVVIRYEGNDGLYCWAVCYQIFLILQMMISCIDISIFSIGGVLYGEEDVTGLYYLYRKCLYYLIFFIVIYSSVIILFPDFWGDIFGNRGEDKLDLLPGILKRFSIFLLPFALVSQVRTIYTIIERGKLSLLLCIILYGFMMAFTYIGPIIKVDLLWWSFPLAAWFVFISLFLYTLFFHFINKNLRLFTLIPKTESGKSMNFSVELNMDDIITSDKKIEAFLTDNGLQNNIVKKITTYCMVLMKRILIKLRAENITKRYLDIHLRLKPDLVDIILKDDSPRLDTNEASQISSILFGEGDENILENKENVNSEKPDYYYFYLNGVNIYTMEVNIPKDQKG